MLQDPKVTEVMVPVVVKADEIIIRLGGVPVLTINGHICMPDGNPASRLTVSMPVRTEHLLAVTAELQKHFGRAVAEMFKERHTSRSEHGNMSNEEVAYTDLRLRRGP
jgi:hypothetical protein